MDPVWFIDQLNDQKDLTGGGGEGTHLSWRSWPVNGALSVSIDLQAARSTGPRPWPALSTRTRWSYAIPASTASCYQPSTSYRAVKRPGRPCMPQPRNWRGESTRTPPAATHWSKHTHTHTQKHRHGFFFGFLRVVRGALPLPSVKRLRSFDTLFRLKVKKKHWNVLPLPLSLSIFSRTQQWAYFSFWLL